MEIGLLSKENVLKNGVDFEEGLWFSPPYEDVVVDAEKNGAPFTALAYELHQNGNLAYYISGINDGEMVEFYNDGNIESVSNIPKEASNGYQVSYFENEKKDLK